MFFRIFDCWRFLAALGIMVYHYLFFAPGLDGAAGPAFLFRLSPMLDMFFMISGFLIMIHYHHRIATLGECGVFLRRRIARLYPLHLLTLGFFVAIVLAGALGIIQLNDQPRWRLADLPLQLLGIHAWGTTDILAFNYPSWSVSAEFMCYLAFPALALLARRLGLAGYALVLLAYVALLEALSRAGVFATGHWTTADTLGAYRALADFAAGGLAAMIVMRRPFEVGSHWPGFLALALAVASMMTQSGVYLSLLLVAASIVLIGLSESGRPESTRALHPLMALTQVSFGIYLWHGVMEMIFFNLIWKRFVGPAGTIDFFVFWWLPMIATVLVAILSNRTYEAYLGRLLAGRRRGAGLVPAA